MGEGNIVVKGLRGVDTFLSLFLELTSAGIPTFSNANDSGYYSPVQNTANILDWAVSHPEYDIHGVLMIHDDLIVNMTQLDAIGFPCQNYIFFGSTT